MKVGHCARPRLLLWENEQAFYFNQLEPAPACSANLVQVGQNMLRMFRKRFFTMDRGHGLLFLFLADRYKTSNTRSRDNLLMLFTAVPSCTPRPPSGLQENTRSDSTRPLAILPSQAMLARMRHPCSATRWAIGEGIITSYLFLIVDWGNRAARATWVFGSKESSPVRCCSCFRYHLQSSELLELHTLVWGEAFGKFKPRTDQSPVWVRSLSFGFIPGDQPKL